MTDHQSVTLNQFSWNHKQGPGYLPRIRSRLQGVDLVWVSQFLDILQSQDDKSASIKDVGCQSFQFYKELKQRGITTDYQGYELDQSSVDLGLEFFPELKGKVIVGDFAKLSEVQQTDVTVCSATIEHIDNWVDFLQRLLNTTSHTTIIRTFLGEETQRELCNHIGASAPYPIWQFSFRDFLTEIRRCGFFPEICRDQYTDSLPKFLDVLPDGTIRTQFVIIARRIDKSA